MFEIFGDKTLLGDSLWSKSRDGGRWGGGPGKIFATRGTPSPPRKKKNLGAATQTEKIQDPGLLCTSNIDAEAEQARRQL